MMRVILLFFFSFIFSFSQERCGAEFYRDLLIEKNLFHPLNISNRQALSIGQYDIPVVFHIIYNLSLIHI